MQGKQEHLNKHVCSQNFWVFLEFCCLEGAETCVRVSAVMLHPKLGWNLWVWGISVGKFRLRGVLVWWGGLEELLSPGQGKSQQIFVLPVLEVDSWIILQGGWQE